VVAAVLGFGFAGAGVASALPIGTTHPTGAAAVVHQVRVGDSEEAWYSSSGSLCLPLVGCLPLPLPISLYPAGTMHVGITAGKETARSYVVPDLNLKRLPGSGELVLPVDTDPVSGTTVASLAHIKACLTTGTVPDEALRASTTAGSAPAVNCKVSAAAKYDAADSEFVVNLRPFLARWLHGARQRGVALLPADTGGVDTWQVAFIGKTGKGTPVHSLLSYVARAEVKPTPAVSPTPLSSGVAVPPVITPVVGVPLPGVGEVAPPAPAPSIAPQPQAAVYIVRSSGFRYPAIFIAPLAILAGVVFFGRLFTGSSVRPRRTRMGADSSDG
jgi:hypothetical protein